MVVISNRSRDYALHHHRDLPPGSNVPITLRTHPACSIHPRSFKNSFSLASPLPLLYYRLSLEVYANCGTNVPLGNGLSRNADLGTASGTGPTQGQSPISFWFELGRIWPAPTEVPLWSEARCSAAAVRLRRAAPPELSQYWGGVREEEKHGAAKYTHRRQHAGGEGTWAAKTQSVSPEVKNTVINSPSSPCRVEWLCKKKKKKLTANKKHHQVQWGGLKLCKPLLLYHIYLRG